MHIDMSPEQPAAHRWHMRPGRQPAERVGGWISEANGLWMSAVFVVVKLIQLPGSQSLPSK